MHDAAEKNIALEQYKILAESVNQLHNTRETSNSFWTAANGLAISAISYANTLSSLTSASKSTLVTSWLLVGLLFCVCWISYLNTIRKSLNLSYEILIETESYFPLRLFQRAYGRSNKQGGNKSLSFKELLVPCIFLGVYVVLILDILFSWNIFRVLSL